MGPFARSKLQPSYDRRRRALPNSLTRHSLHVGDGDRNLSTAQCLSQISSCRLFAGPDNLDSLSRSLGVDDAVVYAETRPAGFGHAPLKTATCSLAAATGRAYHFRRWPALHSNDVRNRYILYWTAHCGGAGRSATGRTSRYSASARRTGRFYWGAGYLFAWAPMARTGPHC